MRRQSPAAADGAKVIAYVVREGQTKKRGAYIVTRSDEGGSELGSKSEAYRWPPERRAAAQTVADVVKGRVVPVTRKRT